MSKNNKVVLTLHEVVDFNKLKLMIACEELDDETRKQLKAYFSKKDELSIPVNYNYSKNLIDKGRLYAQNSLSLQNLKKEIRHELARDIYRDIDMVNAHPTLILQFCKKNKIECAQLEEYVKNREKILKKITDFYEITREQAKKLMLRLCYLGKIAIETDDEVEDFEPEKKMKILLAFQQEMKDIASAVCKIESAIFKLVEKDKTKTHKKSATLSIVAQILENNCLMAMKDFFIKNKVKVGVLCFDGMMIDKSCTGNNILRDCESYVKSKTGYSIKLEEKEMDSEFPFDLPEFSNFVDSDKEAQERLFEIEGKEKFKFCKGQLYIFNEKNGMYDTNLETLYYYIVKNADYLNIITESKTESYGKSSILMKRMVPFVRTSAHDDEWLDKKANSSLGYLLFKNGIYDMKKSKFTEGFNPKIIFFNSIPWNYTKKIQEEVDYAYKISFKRLFKDPKPMIAALARALAGDISIKKLYLCPGKTNAGKSFLSKMLGNAFGGYVGYFNAESFAYTSSKDTKDEAAKMRWALLLKSARILLSNEVNMKRSLDGNCIKKHSSGGDKITARTHGKEETQFIPHYTIFCMMNDIPKIEPMDEAVVKRLEYIEFPFKFVDEDEKGKKPFYKVKDLDLDKKILKASFIRGFIHIILDGYKDYLENGMPEFDSEVKENWTAENKQNNEIIDKIKENYEITEDDNDIVTIQEFKKFREDNKKIFRTISPQKFNEILREELELVEGPRTNGRCWKGIKKREIIEI